MSMDSLTSLTVQPDCSDLISLSEALRYNFHLLWDVFDFYFALQ